jgi:hypothetical protein
MKMWGCENVEMGKFENERIWYCGILGIQLKSG